MDNTKNKKEPLHFEISSRVVWQLGEELVTDEITAIMELVKNAYDADADWVKVSINLDGTDDRIEIEDNGEGMDYDTIEKAGCLFPFF
ncbi:MAG: ATP-binding protein [Saprospiraceae bacterium]|nr:ATP-binding protein [Saprospiraceae bacterium]